MPHSKCAYQRELVRRGCKQMRCFLWPQYLLRVRIECNDDRRAICLVRVFRRSGYHCLVPEVHPIEDADGEKEGAG